MNQSELFEPTGPEVGPLALQHRKKAAELKRAAVVYESRGWQELAHQHKRRALDHETEAECRRMLLQFDRLGGVVS